MRGLSGSPLRLMAAAASVLILSAACGPPGGTSVPSTPGGTTAAPTATAAAVPTFPTEAITFSQIDYQGANNPALGEAIDDLIAAFQTAHPNVTINRTNTTFTDLLTTQQLMMSGPNPCDICDIAVNYTAAGNLAQGGLLLDLDKYSEQYGWEEKYSPFLWSQSQYGPPLTTGPIYGLFLTEDIVGIYYNKQKLGDLGLSLPGSFEEFETMLGTIKTAGERPIMFGNLDKWPAIHVFEQIHNAHCDKTYLRNYVYRLADASFDEPCMLESAQKFVDWLQAGYFGDEDPNALGMDDAKNAFIAGEAVFYTEGTWSAASIDEGMGDNVGFFNIPARADGSVPFAVLGGLGQTFTIHGKTKYPDVAAAYLDTLVSDEAGQMYLDAGAVPGFAFTKSKTYSSLREEVIAAIAHANATDALVGYDDGPTPRMYDVMSAAMQDLMAGRLTPQEFVDTVQADYAKGP